MRNLRLIPRSIGLILLLLLASGCTTPSLLPQAIYYLGSAGEMAQIWRMDAGGINRVQITNEGNGIQDFAVSPADGSLAFVSDNRLYLVDASGQNRHLIADGSTVDPGIEDYVFHGTVNSPVFSPDGQTLAYAFDGLHLFDLATRKDEHELTNLGNPLLGEAYVFSREAYSPGPWSPDGSKLLIVMGYYEGSTLAVMDLKAAQPFTRLRTNGPACCYFSWTKDSRAVLVANPTFSTNMPGLWRYDAETGQETSLLQGLTGSGPMNYAGWPIQPAKGGLYFFYVNQGNFSPEVGIPLAMVRSEPDGSSLAPLRSEEFHIAEALWAPDGSLAVIVGRAGEGSWQVMLARSDRSPLQVLIEAGKGIRNLTWGP
jgi:Tol biopolymer transport system component